MKVTIRPPPIEIDVNGLKCGKQCEKLDRHMMRCKGFNDIRLLHGTYFIRCQACLDAEKEEE